MPPPLRTTSSESATALTDPATLSRFREALLMADASRQQQLHAAPRAQDEAVEAVLREAHRETLSAIRAALQRLDAGTFGACTGCRQQIPIERLEYRPWSATCIGCAGR